MKGVEELIHLRLTEENCSFFPQVVYDLARIRR